MELNEIEEAEKMFGGALSMQMMIEREMLGRSQRLILEDSSFLGLKSVTGKLESLDFDDYLGHDNPLKKYHNFHEMQMTGRD